jgi:predicted Zn-ribbon and HTH transcriptional regulator
MPFCPKCRDEFQDWAKTCPDCRVDLVAELPPPPPPQDNPRRILARAQSSPDDLVTIATFSHPTEAYVPKSRLEAEGIPSFVADAATIDTYWLYSNAIGGAKLQVREQDAERALEILNLEADPTGLMEEEFGKARENEKCPKCGSLRIRYERFAKRWVFLSWFVTGLPLPFMKRKWECQDCGHTWRVDKLQEIDENPES